MSNSARRFRDLPLGTRFSYPGHDEVWVILERHGCGLIARWEGPNANSVFQSICSFEHSESACERGKVIVRESDTSSQTEGSES